MTTAPSMAIPTMEVPGLDDTMEMASPYQGHADDFDIDLDVMEDQVSNPDKDMMGADDYPENSLEVEYDADMIDDVAEPTMVDADDQYPETSNSVEMQYNEKIYEAEMAEDDFDQDFDAHVSDFQEEPKQDVPTVQVNDQEVPEAQQMEELPGKHGETEHVEPTNGVTDEIANPTLENQVEVSADDSSIPEHNLQEVLQPQHESHGEENLEQEREQEEEQKQEQEQEADPSQRVLDTEKSPQNTNETEQVESQEADLAPHDEHGAATTGQAQDEGRAHEETPPPVDEQQGTKEEVEPKESLDTHEEVGHETDTHEHASALYPVKVYYQDNEISLFPPREGDSSETFFLEDENLAYEHFGKLLESCREVLREHIADTEVLVVDIEALNLQLTEDSSHISKVTLYQLVDLYLRLCHNDGVEEPEALYLTLSTKLTIAAEVSDLLVAADEGKGLSEVLPWDGYHETGEFSPEHWEGNDQVEGLEEPLEEAVNPKNDGQPEAHDNLDASAGAPVPDAVPTENIEQPGQGESVSAQDNNGQASGSADQTIEPNGAEKTLGQEAVPREADNVQAHDSGSPDERAYDSEEQRTESTTTIAPLSGLDVGNEQQNAAQSTNILPDDQTVHDTVYGHDGAEGDDGLEDQYQEATTQEPAQNLDSDEPKHPTASDLNGNEGDAVELDVKEHREDLPADHPESLHSEDEVVAVTTNDPENDTEATLQGDDGVLASEGVEPNQDHGTSELPEGQTQPPTGNPDDTLDVAEDPSKSPVQDAALEGGIENADPSEIIPDEVKQVPSTTDPSQEDIVELTFDDDDDEYLDLNLGDEFNFEDEEPAPDSTGPASTKRQREPEDETELAQSPTPDAKRSRSS